MVDVVVIDVVGRSSSGGYGFQPGFQKKPGARENPVPCGCLLPIFVCENTKPEPESRV